MINHDIITNENNNTVYVAEIDKKIILFRCIFCCISFTCCFFLMIIYFILILQAKFNLCKKKNNDNKENNDIDSITDSNNSEIPNAEKKKNKIGLGSNFMFLLNLSNLLSSLFEILFYFYYIDIIDKYDISENNQSEIYREMNEGYTCTFYGFAHNIFDLFSVCWTTMLTLLFYRSTNLSHEMLYKDKKYLIIGFIYSILLCLIFCGLPIATDSYGFSRYYCSYKYDDFDEKGNHIEESSATIGWRYSFAIVTFANNFANVIWLFKTNNYYSKKLKLIKNQNKNEYKIMRKIVWIFRIFPIVLIISRLSKGMTRTMIEYLKVSPTLEAVIQYFNGFFFASTGIFDSIACTFFFSGVFWCCETNSISENLTSDNKEYSDLDLIENENVDKN